MSGSAPRNKEIEQSKIKTLSVADAGGKVGSCPPISIFSITIFYIKRKTRIFLLMGIQSSAKKSLLLKKIICENSFVFKIF